MLAVDVSPWLRSDAPCSPDRLFCHVYGRAKTASQFIPGWPYSFVAVLEPPTGDVQQQPIQRPAYERGVGLVRERARVGVVVVTAVDPATQQLLIAIHPYSVPATIDNIAYGLGTTDPAPSFDPEVRGAPLVWLSASYART